MQQVTKENLLLKGCSQKTNKKYNLHYIKICFQYYVINCNTTSQTTTSKITIVLSHHLFETVSTETELYEFDKTVDFLLQFYHNWLHYISLYRGFFFLGQQGNI